MASCTRAPITDRLDMIQKDCDEEKGGRSAKSTDGTVKLGDLMDDPDPDLTAQTQLKSPS